jgi:hypothetical protein
MAKPKRMMEDSRSYWKSIEEISREVDNWPKWKKNLSGLESNYCSQLHPLRGEYSTDDKA